MDTLGFPLAVRLAGFGPAERSAIEAALTRTEAEGPHYRILVEESLQEPHVYVVNADNPRAAADLLDPARPPHQPLLMVTSGACDSCYPCLARPFNGDALRGRVDALVRQRSGDILAHHRSSNPIRSERRRRPRLAQELEQDWEERRRPRPKGAVLVVDSGSALRDRLAGLLKPERRPVEWTDGAATAVRLCDETEVALVLVNAAATGIDPYDLSGRIKSLPAGRRTPVVVLAAPGRPYDVRRGRLAGVRGVLDHPIQNRDLAGTLTRLLSLPL
jgi:CheY-like chemotaxis protein